MRPGPPVQPSHRRPPRRQHPHQQQLHQERDRQRQRQHWLHLPQQPRANGGSPRALLVLLLLASSPLVLVQAEPPGLLVAQSQHQAFTGHYPTGLALRSRSSAIESRKQKQNLTIGYLTAIKGGLKDRQGLAISGALSMALDEINNDSNILPNVTLLMRWNDTRGETVEATRAMIDMICDGVVAFFGPEGSCYVEAIVAQSRNIPMISYKCSDYKASNVNTFARTEPPDTQVTKSVIALLLHYGWNKFSIVAEKAWSTVARSLEQEAHKNNLTVNHHKFVEDRHTCCEERMPCCEVPVWFQLIQETKNKTRIYIFLGTAMSLIDMMNSMQNQKLLDNGEYMVIYVDIMFTYSPREAQKYLWKPEHLSILKNCLDPKNFLQKARSLMVIVSSPPTQVYEVFTKKVREYNSKKPFNFTTPELLKKFEKYVSIHAAYLYDSVKLYARALDQLLRDQPNQTLMEVAGNGTRIIETIIKKHTYQSVSGAIIKLDQFGDSEGNFSVLALKKEPFNLSNFTCDYQMKPVGQFQQGETLVYRPSGAMDWPGKNKPEAEPGCGFFNEHCPKKDTHHHSIIAAGVLGVLVICATAITISIYRKWKIEQEIEGLLWRIDLSEIHSPHLDNMMSSPSKLSLVSAMSYESKCGGQVFAQTGHYRGVVVRIKELKFSKKKDISRDDMKELRILREIRHDNLNSFIGACVEPMRILLLTEYCAKGSLYDIIENEDIKLDNMFITSLVHDLIKGMLYIHDSPVLVCHGNLKSSNCVVTSRWVLQVSDFGLHDMRHCAESGSIGEHQYYQNLLWKAPELLREPNNAIRGTQKGDVYSFAIILFEMIGRKGPYGITMDPKDIIERVKNYNPKEKEEDKKKLPFRPDIDVLTKSKADCAEYVVNTITDCWDEDPNIRPDFKVIRTRLMAMKAGTNQNIMDQMMHMMETYANNLEDLVSERTRLLFEEKQKTEDLLHRMLPKPVANRLTDGIGVEPEAFDLVTIYFSDIVGFTAMSAESTPFEVVNFLNDLYTLFDRIIKGYDVYKVETIGDAYMVVSGLPIKNGDRHAGEIASMSLELLNAVKQHTIAHRPHETLKLRIGIHTGPVVAGVVGLTMPRYCLFGDTVNTASRMESNGEPLRIHISEQCKNALDKIGGYIIEERGFIHMKGKGEVKTYWLTGATEKAIQKREVDVGDLPPLFCTPRRRQSNVPRLLADDSSSQCGGSSPVPRSFHAPKFEGSRLFLAKSVSKTTIDNVPIMEEIQERTVEIKRAFEDFLADTGPKFRKNARLSTIASSSSTSDYPSQLVIRESRSLDPFPCDIYNKHLEAPSLSWKEPKKIFCSLENCVKFTRINSKTDISEKMLDNNHPNGNVIIVPHSGNSPNEAEMPLLGDDSGCIGEVLPIKRWRSLDQEISGPSTDSVPDKKSSARNSIRSWLVNLFNGTGLRSSEVYLGKGMERYEMQPERESIV